MINEKKLFCKTPDELVIMHLWQHPFIFIKIFLLYLVLFLVPVIIYLFFSFYDLEFSIPEVFWPLAVAFIFAYYLIILLLAFHVWVEDYLDIRTITNKRIISREQHGLFNRTVAELELYRVQDVMVEQKGLFPTLFNYGNIFVQSAGSQERFIFKNISQPVKISRLIQKLDQDAKKNHAKSSS